MPVNRPSADFTRLPRLFVAARLDEAAAIPLTLPQAHHLGTVLRLAAGDRVRLFNGRDGEWLADIAALTRGRAGSLVATARLRPQAAEPDPWLLYAPLKRGPGDLVVQKATELGASRLLPVQTARTNTERLNPERLAAIATEAAEQSERLSLPAIAPIAPLAAVLTAWPPNRPLYAAIEREAAPALLTAAMDRPGAAALLVGPEGGFTAAELDALRAHPFVRPVTLGSRILRAETAAIAGLAILMAASGRDPP